MPIIPVRHRDDNDEDRGGWPTLSDALDAEQGVLCPFCGVEHLTPTICSRDKPGVRINP